MHFLTPFLFFLPTLVLARGGHPLNITFSATANDMSNGSSCKELTVIFARGTTEDGNIGLRVGPPLHAALTAVFGIDSIAVQGVDYIANYAGYMNGGDSEGSMLMAKLVGQAMEKCPETKVVMSGYR
jgi:cutinase